MENKDKEQRVINEAEVLSIRRLKAKGVTYREIAERIGISTSQVYFIVSGRNWKNVPLSK